MSTNWSLSTIDRWCLSCMNIQKLAPLQDPRRLLQPAKLTITTDRRHLKEIENAAINFEILNNTVHA